MHADNIKITAFLCFVCLHILSSLPELFSRGAQKPFLFPVPPNCLRCLPWIRWERNILARSHHPSLHSASPGEAGMEWPSLAARHAGN